MRQERTDDLDLLSVFHVPEEDHLVAVDCNDSVPLLVRYDREHIREFAGLVLRHLNLFHACLNVGLAQRWWLLQSDYVLQSLWVEHANYAIGASAVQGIAGGVNSAAKRPNYLDVHPLAELALFSEDVEVAIGGQGVGKRVLASYAYEDLRLHLVKVSCETLQDTLSGALHGLLLHLSRTFLEIPELQMGVSCSNKIALVAVESERVD